jgi:hypothetical protein
MLFKLSVSIILVSLSSCSLLYKNKIERRPSAFIIDGSSVESLDGACSRLLSKFLNINIVKDDYLSLKYAREYREARLGNYDNVDSAYSIELEVKKQKENGIFKSVSHLLNLYDIPTRFHRYYNKDTGKFRYLTSEPVELALENGSSKLSMIRINYLTDGYKDISHEVVSDYIEAMKIITDFKLVIVVASYQKKMLVDQLAGIEPSIRRRINISTINVPEKLRKQITSSSALWAQDSSKPLANGSATYMHNDGYSVKRPIYKVFTKALVKSGHAKVKQSLFDFEGGNLIVGDKHIFLGADTIKSLSDRLEITQKQAVKTFEVEFGKPVIPIGLPYEVKRKGFTLQNGEVFHIDLSMAIVRDLSDKEVVREIAVVSSPEKLFDDFFNISNIGSKSKEEYIEITSSLLRKITKNKWDESITATERKLYYKIAMLTYTDMILKIEETKFIKYLLEKQGYKTKEVAGFYPPGKLSMDGDGSPIINFTNVIISGDNVIIPYYKSKKLMESAEKTYRDLGYNVILAKSSEGSFCLDGGIRCLSETHRQPVYSQDD